MLRYASFKLVSALLLLFCFLPSHQALAASPVVCQASDAPSFQTCAAQINSGAANEIMITAMIPCAGTNACKISLSGANVPSSITITGDPSQHASAVGLQRTTSFGYTLIDINGLSKVTLSNFTIYDDPTPASSITVDGTVYVYNATTGANDQYLDVFCGTSNQVSTVSSPSMQGTVIANADVGVSCPMPGYVTVIEPSLQSDGTYQFEYFDVNAACFEETNPQHNCVADVTVESSTNVTISGVTIDHSQSDAIDVSSTTGFYFENNSINNSYFRGLTIGSSTDVSIENNSFFANRAAGLRANIAASSSTRPSDISNNIFDHDQHGDAFPCDQSEGCSGGQIAVAGSDFVLYGNTFINGFMDFYDPNVFEEPYGYDGFSGCDLSAQCDYSSYSQDTDYMSLAGMLWLNGGGVETGPNDNGPYVGPHDNPDTEITAPLGNDVVFSNNLFDHGAYAVSYDDQNDPTGLQISNNEMFENSKGLYFRFDEVTVFSANNCTASAGCGSASDVTLAIVQVGPTTAAKERSDCGALNCLWVQASEAWSPASNSLMPSSNGAAMDCALKIYGPGGSTLLSTVQGSGNAICNAGGGTFTIPASVAQHQTSVQLSFENLNTGVSSAKQLVTLYGMTPTITGTGLGCTGNTCIWITATDTSTSCAVGLYNPSTLASIMTLSGSQVDCNQAGEVTFVIPTSIKNNYSSIVVNYQNLTQGTWSGQSTVTISTGGTGSGGGGGGGGTGCGGTTCQQQ